MTQKIMKALPTFIMEINKNTYVTAIGMVQLYDPEARAEDRIFISEFSVESTETSSALYANVGDL